MEHAKSAGGFNLPRLSDEHVARDGGNTVKFYEWLKALKSGALPVRPPTWICGDCHLGNLGPLANANGRIEIQIRDLDQTVIGNPAHDLIASDCLSRRPRGGQNFLA